MVALKSSAKRAATIHAAALATADATIAVWIQWAVLAARRAVAVVLHNYACLPWRGHPIPPREPGAVPEHALATTINVCNTKFKRWQLARQLAPTEPI